MTITDKLYIFEDYDPFKDLEKGPQSVGKKSQIPLWYSELPAIKPKFPARTIGYYPLKDRDIFYLSMVIDSNMKISYESEGEQKTRMSKVRQFVFIPVESRNCAMDELMYLWIQLKVGVVCYRKKYMSRYGTEKEKLVIKIHEKWTKLFEDSFVDKGSSKESFILPQYVVQDHCHPCFTYAGGYSNILEGDLEFTPHNLYEQLFLRGIDTVAGNSFMSVQKIARKKKFAEERNEETEKLAAMIDHREGYTGIQEEGTFYFGGEPLYSSDILVNETEETTLCDQIDCCIIL